jgi:hypothetical protein
MIGAVGTSYQAMIFPEIINSVNQRGANSSLNDTELEAISSILKEYDSSTLTAEDAMSIAEAFEEVGIKPSPALEKAMASHGFDALEVGDLAKSRESIASYSPSFPSDFGGTKEEEESFLSIFEELFKINNSNAQDQLSEDIMDYTTKFLYLNDSSKQEVMGTLSKFLDYSDSHSSKDIQNGVKNALSSILDNSNNYTSISFYA